MSTAQELASRVDEFISQLATSTDTARTSATFLAYLATAAKFHHYSLQNIGLILFQQPEATRVAGFHTWLKFCRHVRKGEKGIAILAPLIRKVDTDAGEKVPAVAGYRTVYVFDVSQTEGEPLPEPPTWTSPERQADLHQRLIAYATSLGVSVHDVPNVSNHPSAQGSYNRRTNLIEITAAAGTQTLIHEIAHAILHGQHIADAHLPPQAIRELQAESVAFVVARHFGLDTSAAPNYLALHGLKAEHVKAHMHVIGTVARGLIEAIDPTRSRESA